jgi:hypothetical protein
MLKRSYDASTQGMDPNIVEDPDPWKLKEVSMTGKKIIAVLFLVFVICSLGRAIDPQQEILKPLTIQEVVTMLKQIDSRRHSQAEIADEIDRRGIGFVVDEKVLNDLQNQGAKTFLLDVIKRAATANSKSTEGNPAITDEEAQKRAEAASVATLPLLEQTRRYALAYARELPDFITTQVVKRYIQTPDLKDWKLEDTLEIELTYSSQKGEQFKLLRIDGKPTKLTYEEVGGSTSTGEFGTMLASLFLPQTRTEFREAKKETFNGKPTVIYDFTVKKGNSMSSISDRASGKTTLAGYRGSLWIDTESKRVLRVESANEGMPADFPITLSENAVEYEWVKIEGAPYLLPVRAELLLGRDRERAYTRNVIEFKNYKKFEASIKIQDDKGQ